MTRDDYNEILSNDEVKKKDPVSFDTVQETPTSSSPRKIVHAAPRKNKRKNKQKMDVYMYIVIGSIIVLFLVVVFLLLGTFHRPPLEGPENQNGTQPGYGEVGPNGEMPGSSEVGPNGEQPPSPPAPPSR